ncbi:hypothetical protein BJV74DRAFT_868202 [Russula compacta]|nr:hypothetical protein BJV74DRAFT_868202 [Russula compacta]
MNSIVSLTTTSLTAQYSSTFYPNRLALLSYKMATPCRIRTQQATENLSLSVTPVQATEAQSFSRVGRDAHPSRPSFQNSSPSHPRIPRPVLRYGKSTTSTLDSQFQVNASQVQRPLSLIVPNESAGKSNTRTLMRRAPPSRDERPSRMEFSSSSSSEQHGSCRGIRASQKLEKSRRRDRRASPPTDSDDEDPFHFDSILSSPPNKKEEGCASRTLSSSLLRRASIVPVDPTAAPAPHRFSLLRERASEETIFVQEICDAEGRRWSLRVPASGLPEDMVHMLEELEKLAVELGQALPKIVVTCSAESLSLKRMERDVAVNSSESELRLRPPHHPIDDENSVECDLSTGRSLAKEKRRLVEPEKVSEELGGSTEPTSAAVSSTSEQSLTCIYLPELAPEFLSGSSTSPVLQPADGFHSKPAQTIQCPRQRAFFSALREPQPASSIAKRLVLNSAKTESKTTTGAGAATEAVPFFLPTASSAAKSKSRVHAASSKSALPIPKANSKSPATSTGALAEIDRRRARQGWLSESPPQPDSLRAPSAAHEQQPPSDASDYVPPPPPLPLAKTNATTTLMMTLPAGAVAGAGAGDSPQHPAAIASSSSSSQPQNRGPPARGDVLRSVSAPAVPPTGRKFRHFFRRPPVRSVSDPPSYSYPARPVMMDDGGGAKRPVSEVVPTPREVVERRMPRLPSARDLLRKLT